MKKKESIFKKTKYHSSSTFGIGISETTRYLRDQISEEQVLDIAREVKSKMWEGFEFFPYIKAYFQGKDSETSKKSKYEGISIRINPTKRKYLLFGPKVNKVDVYDSFQRIINSENLETYFNYYFVGRISNKELQNIYAEGRNTVLENISKEKQEKKAKKKEQRIKILQTLEHILGLKEELTEENIFTLANAVPYKDWTKKYSNLIGLIPGTNIKIEISEPEKKYVVTGQISTKVQIPDVFNEKVSNYDVIDFYNRIVNRKRSEKAAEEKKMLTKQKELLTERIKSFN